MSTLAKLNREGNILDAERDKLRRKGLSVDEVNRLMLPKYRRFWNKQNSYLAARRNGL